MLVSFAQTKIVCITCALIHIAPIFVQCKDFIFFCTATYLCCKMYSATYERAKRSCVIQIVQVLSPLHGTVCICELSVTAGRQLTGNCLVVSLIKYTIDYYTFLTSGQCAILNTVSGANIQLYIVVGWRD